MNRRDFMAAVGGAMAWPATANAQQEPDNGVVMGTRPMAIKIMWRRVVYRAVAMGKKRCARQHTEEAGQNRYGRCEVSAPPAIDKMSSKITDRLQAISLGISQ